MNTLNNKTLRVEGTDIVTTETFNQVFSSLDRTLFTINEVQTPPNSYSTWTFGSHLTNNINIFISLRTDQLSRVSIKINYYNQMGLQEYVVLDSFDLSASEIYNFSPIFISILNSSEITLAINTTSPIYISASAIAT